jgi:hypothetical protein
MMGAPTEAGTDGPRSQPLRIRPAWIRFAIWSGRRVSAWTSDHHPAFGEWHPYATSSCRRERTNILVQPNTLQSEQLVRHIHLSYCRATTRLPRLPNGRDPRSPRPSPTGNRISPLKEVELPLPCGVRFGPLGCLPVRSRPRHHGAFLGSVGNSRVIASPDLAAASSCVACFVSVLGSRRYRLAVSRAVDAPAHPGGT